MTEHLQETEWAIYTTHLGGNFRCKYAVLQLVQMQHGKITKCTV